MTEEDRRIQLLGYEKRLRAAESAFDMMTARNADLKNQIEALKKQVKPEPTLAEVLEKRIREIAREEIREVVDEHNERMW
jgi:cell division protein FtsB